MSNPYTDETGIPRGVESTIKIQKPVEEVEEVAKQQEDFYVVAKRLVDCIPPNDRPVFDVELFKHKGMNFPLSSDELKDHLLDVSVRINKTIKEKKGIPHDNRMEILSLLALTIHIYSLHLMGDKQNESKPKV